MADKSVGELIAAQSVTPTDLFVLEQNGTAKKLTGQTLENWLLSFADGHGGIQRIEKVSTDVLADTYRITLADTTTFDFVVTNGRGVSNIQKKSTSGLVDTYAISYNDGTSGTFTVTNGAKGDKGDNAYIWVKYASRKPVSSAVSLGDIPDAWMGVYVGTRDTAPTSYSEYKWYQIKGEKGDTGDPATLTSSKVEYQVGDSGYILPSGAWSESVPVVPQGKYLWTRITNTFNTGYPVVSYSVSRMGMDGSGSVSSVANVSPDENGNVPLTAEHVGAVSSSGGAMTGHLNMNGNRVQNVAWPETNEDATNLRYVNSAVKMAAPRNNLDNSDFSNPVNQRGQSVYDAGVYTIDRWYTTANGATSVIVVNDGYITLSSDTSKYKGLNQRYADNTLVAGKEYTVAIWLLDGSVLVNHAVIPQNNGSVDIKLGEKLQARLSHNSFGVILWNNADTITYKVKHVGVFEGVYTAETIPDYQPKGYGAELSECQRYLQRFRTSDLRKTYCEDFRPTMRMTPQGTVSHFDQNVNGTAYYFASAEL